MNIVNNIQNLVEVQWEVQDTDYPYMDTYYFTPEEYAAITPQELQARQEAQYNEWLAYMRNPEGN